MIVYWQMCKYYTENEPYFSTTKAQSLITDIPWWRHQIETFSVLLAICVRNFPVPGEFPAQRPVPRSFDALFDLLLNQRLSKQSWGWWFETLSRKLWRHCNATPICSVRPSSFSFHIIKEVSGQANTNTNILTSVPAMLPHRQLTRKR